jgi:general secretion pathway protein G
VLCGIYACSDETARAVATRAGDASGVGGESADYNGPMNESPPMHPAPRALGHRRNSVTPACGGFTLIEIMVVIVILGVLAALVVPSVLSRTDDARNVAAKSDLAAIRQALKLYRLDNQRYPSTEQGLEALVAKPVDPPVPPNWKPGGYLEKLPRDPWGHPYHYVNPGLKGDVDVVTYGADGQPGGTGADADIGSWDL